MIINLQFFGGRGASAGNIYTRGNTTYSVTSDGKNFFLNMQTGVINDKVKIAYAKNDDKARITVPGVGVVLLKEDPQLLELLKKKRGQS